MFVVLLFLLTSLSAADKIENLTISCKELEEKFSQQKGVQVAFDSALAISLPIYFTTYESIDNVSKAAKLSQDRGFLQKTLNELAISKPYNNAEITLTPSFFKNYPQQFTYVENMTYLTLDGHKIYKEENGHQKIFSGSLFWLNKQCAIEKGYADRLYLIQLNDTAHTFSYSELSQSAEIVKNYAQHPILWNDFYLLLSPSPFSKKVILQRVKFDNTNVLHISNSKEINSLALPLIITPHDCSLSLILSDSKTYYILGKKSYHNKGTRLILELHEGIERLRRVHKLIMQDFEKACKSGKATQVVQNKFFAQHHLRRNFLDHWISYKIAQIEKS